MSSTFFKMPKVYWIFLSLFVILNIWKTQINEKEREKA